jgi:glycosyltransferase involved in cell wall biosynthesis
MKISEKKQWLILAHCYNMDGRAASQTITDRIPFLMSQGVKPIVISAPTGKKDKRVPHYQIFSPAPSGLKFELRHLLRKRGATTFSNKIVKLLITIILLPFFAIEKAVIQLDSHWSWFLSASLYGISIIRRRRPELIYSTAGPSSTHYAGYILSKTFKLPWIAELHDPLIYDNEKQKWHKYFFHKNLEKLIFRNAHKIIYFTNKAGANAEKRNPGFKDKLVIIRPGASPAETWSQQYQKQKKMHFGYFGSLALKRNLRDVFKAFYELFQEKPDLSKEISINIYGTTLDQVSSQTLNQYHLKGIVKVHGRLEHDPATGKTGREQVLEAMKRMDVLILVHGNDIFRCNEYIPSKLYDYMLVQRPILGLTHSGSELEQMLEQNGFLSADSQDLDEIKTKISTLIEHWKTTGLPDLERPSHMTVEVAVHQLMNIRNSLIKSQ